MTELGTGGLKHCWKSNLLYLWFASFIFKVNGSFKKQVRWCGCDEVQTICFLSVYTRLQETSRLWILIWSQSSWPGRSWPCCSAWIIIFTCLFNWWHFECFMFCSDEPWPCHVCGFFQEYCWRIIRKFSQRFYIYPKSLVYFIFCFRFLKYI